MFYRPVNRLLKTTFLINYPWKEYKKFRDLLNDKNKPFVGKIIEDLVTVPKFMPPYLHFVEMNKDWNAVKGLPPLERAANLPYFYLSDTILLAGSEVYDASLSITTQ